MLGGVLSAVFEQEVGQVAQERLFGPLGMEAVWWTDAEGHSLTYCCIDSTALDFARFGLLFARGGEWDGAQLVPSDYVTESTTAYTAGGYYGLHWWIYSEEMFASIGLDGQNIYVYPADDLVVARFGRYTQIGEGTVRDEDWANYHDTEDYGAFDDVRFLEMIQEALGG